MFCLTCKRLSPSGSVYCQHCPGGRSFNCIICTGGHHRCSVGTVSCPQDGSGEFSEHTWGIPVGWLAKIATVAVLVGLWKLTVAHHGILFSALGSVASIMFGILTNTDARALPNLVQTAIGLAFTGWWLGLLLYLLPGQGWVVGKFLRGFPVRIALFALKITPRLLTRLWGAVMALAGLAGNKAPAHPAKPRGGKGE